VLAVARTITSANRLLDVLPVFTADTRIQVVFTVADGSQFHDGVTDRIRAKGFRIISWAQAVRTRFDLAISASDRGRLAEIAAPLLLIPHGVGYHRRAETPTQPGHHAISGLTAAALHRARTTAPTTVAVAHPRQLDQLRAVSEPAAQHAVVTGDPCLDRMLASLSLREKYRHAFHARDRRLILLSSTWGRFSLLGSDPTLPARLLAQLPLDEYRVAAALHPNVWARHGSWQVRRWLADALDAGLMLVPPEEGWRAAVIAADLVITDHSSVTCYAAALGRPLLLAADGNGEVVPGSGMDALRTALARLTAEPFTAQIDRAMDDHDPDKMIALTEPIFAHRHQAKQRLHSTLYRLLRLTPPSAAVTTRRLPVPDVPRHSPDAIAVRTAVIRPARDHLVVTLSRLPAGAHDQWIDEPHPVHLVAHGPDTDPLVSQSAAIIMATEPAKTLDTASGWAVATLARFPGARIAAAAANATVDGAVDGAVAERIVLRVQPDITVQVTTTTPGLDPAGWASAVYAGLVSETPLTEINRLTVHIGHLTATAELAVIAPPDQESASSA
jgi:hypothetical protein